MKALTIYWSAYSKNSIGTVSGSTATVNNAGESLIYASQAGDATYASVSFEQHQLVIKATATVTLSNLSQEYTGSGISATGSTDPVDLGSYAVSADVEEANYIGNDTGMLPETAL